MDRESKQEARVSRFRALALAAQKQSDAAYLQSKEMGSAIPCGQPVHGAQDRKYREKIWDKMGQSVKFHKKADYYTQKADAAERNNNIYLDDDNAVEKLEEKLKDLECLQNIMVKTNKTLRSKKSEVEKHDELLELGLSEHNVNLLLLEKKGFASYQLSNNNANIHRVREQLAKARMMKETEPKEYILGDDAVKVVENYAENRLQLFFNGKPDADLRSQMKKNGFRWSPKNECWQSYLKRQYIQFVKDTFQ